VSLLPDSPFDFEAGLTTEQKNGKAFVRKILELKKEYKKKFNRLPDLLLIHPTDAKWVGYYLNEVTAGRAYYPESDAISIETERESIPIEVLYDYQRERGSFLLTTREALNGGGLTGGIT